jgi:hypothetical protein
LGPDKLSSRLEVVSTVIRFQVELGSGLSFSALVRDFQPAFKCKPNEITGINYLLNEFTRMLPFCN